MNRRQFLKRIGAVCAAVVVVPIVLVKAGPKWKRYAALWTRENEDNFNKLRAASMGKRTLTATSVIYSTYDDPCKHRRSGWIAVNVFPTEADRLKYRAQRGL